MFVLCLVSQIALQVHSCNTGFTPIEDKLRKSHFYLEHYERSQRRTINTSVSETTFRTQQKLESLFLCFLPVELSLFITAFYLQEKGKHRARKIGK